VEAVMLYFNLFSYGPAYPDASVSRPGQANGRQKIIQK
jgi:hypothetical protein